MGGDGPEHLVETPRLDREAIDLPAPGARRFGDLGEDRGTVAGHRHEAHLAVRDRSLLDSYHPGEGLDAPLGRRRGTGSDDQ